MADLICARCGEPFASRYSGAKYCGPRCRREATQAWNAANHLKRKANPPAAAKEVKRDALSEDALEANRRGMSYGQYAAWKRTHW